ncbi:hypothetical protein N7470_008144 [Penicillium chermesinum]|nr:hypothetical protein N7470_008144 [Penicillium chermesinum]
MEAARASLGGSTSAPLGPQHRSKPGPKPREPISDKYPKDEDGPNYWKMHIMDLKDKGSLNETIQHPMNMDWVLTHEWLEEYFVRLRLQPSFLPRRGEIVLWLHPYEGRLEWNSEGKCYQIRNPDGTWGEKPQWRAGIVTQIPEEPNTYLDILETTKKESPINYSGFRVETLPNPVSDDKSLSLQSKYVPLKCIRPFSGFCRFLQSIPREQFHPSIEHAITTMASWSLLSHIRFHGTWPNALLENRGIYIGSELIALRDVVRLKPFGMTVEDTISGGSVHRGSVDPVDVLIVERIWLEMNECNADPDSPQLAKEMRPFIAGRVYTRDPNRLTRPMAFDKDPLQPLTYDEVCNAFRQVGMHLYGDWYRVAAGKMCVVSPSMILGRCFEPEASVMYNGDDRLDYDLNSVLVGRRFSSNADARIPDGVGWFWGNSRVETLGLATLNDVECGLGAPQRANPGRWQAILKILSGPYTDADIRRAELPRRAGRPSLKKKFGDIGKTSKLVSTGLGGSSSSAASPGAAPLGDMSDDSEAGLSEGELRASIPFRPTRNEDEMKDEAEDGNVAE